MSDKTCINSKLSTEGQVIDQYPIPAFIISKEHTITHFNSACEALTGLNARKMIGSSNQWMIFHTERKPVLADLIVDGASQAQIAFYNNSIKPSFMKGSYGGEVFSKSLREYGKWLYVSAAPLISRDGRILGAIETLEDITAQKRTEEELLIQKAYFQQLFENSPEGIIMVDNRNRILDANREFTNIFQYSPEEIIGRDINETIVPEGYDEEASNIDDALINGKEIRKETVRKRKDGSLVHVSVLGCPIIVNNVQVGIYGIYADITERIRAQETIRHQAYHDSLTGLPNRIMFDDRIVMAISNAERNKEKVGVLFLDLDGFKYINDNMGHQIGDELLVNIARRLRGTVREVDTVSRMGGDEFAIVLPGLSSAEEISTVCSRILDAFTRPFLVKGRNLNITASIGISVYPDNGKDIITLLKKADIAMYRVKDMGKNDYCFFTRDMDDTD